MTPAERFSRQGFLGEQSEAQIASARIGVIGLGGGGSHVVQQLGHLGFIDVVLVDPDRIEESNLNRLVGGTDADVGAGTLKVAIAERQLLGSNPRARPVAIPERWQDAGPALARCHLLFACLDRFSERDQLEAFARRHLIPVIDIGLDVHRAPDHPEEPPQMAGQVILSMPGLPCMRCLGFLSEANLAREAARYGDAGPRPQVVWGNGVLASTAVGLAVDLVTGWSRALKVPAYFCYEANRGTVTDHVRLRRLPPTLVCPHYPLEQVGAPRLVAL